MKRSLKHEESLIQNDIVLKILISVNGDVFIFDDQGL
jgi:hypothetical protein